LTWTGLLVVDGRGLHQKAAILGALRDGVFAIGCMIQNGLILFYVVLKRSCRVALLEKFDVLVTMPRSESAEMPRVWSTSYGYLMTECG
jgi:hypothetical protein